MHRLRSLGVAASFFLGACSFINAPAEIDTGAGAGGTGGNPTTTSPGGSTGGTTTTIETECGDGKVQGAEICDDDNTKAGDGCSPTCTIEDGFTCTTAMEETSVCMKLCGNGVLDMGEECDDDDYVNDMSPTSPGDEDFCTPDCKFKEFDIEAESSAAAHNELPSVGFRKDMAAPAFVVMWHKASTNKIVRRDYKFTGPPATGTGAMDTATSSKPDASGEVICTADSNRSLIFWRDDNDVLLFSRKIESNDMISPAEKVDTIVDAQTRPSCAASPAMNSNTFIVATTGQQGGGLWDILVQPYLPTAITTGVVTDVGDATAPVDTAAWSLSNGFMVAWQADPLSDGPIVAQQLGNNGQNMPGFFFTITQNASDPKPREVVGAHIGAQDGFLFVYSRDSAPDAMGMTHREIILRSFTSPGNGPPPLLVSSDSNVKGEPRVAVNTANNKFIIVWTDENEMVGNKNIVYRTFSGPGDMGSEIKIANDNKVGAQTVPGVAVDPSTGNVAIVWDNFTPNAGKPHKISGKIFAGLLQ